MVTLNYRLGSFGFLAHPALAADGRTGNYGLLDQQAAMRWVQRNIAAFGGDPAKVTIAGGSAGGASVCAHLSAASSAGLFRGAIIQSGPCQSVSVTHGERIAVDYAGKLGCADAATATACLRALPPDKLSNQTLATWTLGGMIDVAMPVGDGQLLPTSATMPPRLGQLVTSNPAGPANKVPVLIGSNHDEVTSVLMRADVKAEQYLDKLRLGYFGQAEAIAAQYPPAAFQGDAGRALAAAGTDGVFACGTRAAARVLAAHAPVYAYELADPDAAAPAVARAKNIHGEPVGSFHGAEIGLLFDTADRTYSGEQQQLADQMIHYWASFVSNGDPATDGQPTWPRYNPADEKVLTLKPNGTTTTDTFAADHRCAFWDALPT